MAIEKSTPSDLTDTNTTKVCKETTQSTKCVKKKRKRRDKSDLGPNFVAPDGGWGWVVCMAAGFSNFSIFPPLQQYGLIYKQRMTTLKFNAKEITTIVNIVMAISSLLGIVNGAMFRRFTFRQVAVTGGLLIFIGILTSAFCQTFLQYILSFSCTYGIGYGLSTAATALAVNTYFKLKRRRATGFSWTISGLGSILFPYVSTVLLSNYGAQGSILIYSAITLNAVLCGCALQPVLWHVKKKADTAEDPNAEEHEMEALKGNVECEYCRLQKQSKNNLFLLNDDTELPDYEISEASVPKLSHANDGRFGSKMSLNSEKNSIYHQKLLRSATNKCNKEAESADPKKPFKIFPEELEKYNNDTTHSVEFCCTCATERALLARFSNEELCKEAEKIKAAQKVEEQAKQRLTFWEKIVRFFDLDLLKDLTFVNLSLGITIMMFGEINFSVLTPFILNSYGYTDQQISLAMSLLGGMDLAVRFIAPLALEKIKLDNRVLFAFGVIAISVARFIVTITDSYNVILAVFVLIGFGKGFRTIFLPLILPSYVPLKRLPAATGLQLISNAIFTFAFGPIIGSITDAFNFTVTIHFINFMTAFALLLWIAESLVRRLLNKPAIPMDQ